ncbi:MAG: HYR domain-containing protein [Bacteroidetes bacterium]|nr:HYR domain-containing protein [Bacteroidota bacterium]
MKAIKFLTNIALYIFMVSIQCYSQGIIVTTGSFVNNPSGFITVNGGLSNSGTVLGGAGTIQLSGNWVNNHVFAQASSTVVFNGAANQSVTKSGGESFYNLTVGMTGGGFDLVSDATITNNLNLTGRMVRTGTNTLYLGPASQLTGEQNSRYVLGRLSTTRAVGTGSHTFGGIGVTMNAGTDNLGNVTILRVSGTDGKVVVGSKSSINRKWTVTATGTPASGRTLTLSWLSDDDNGKDLTTAQVWKSSDNGLNWFPVGSPQNASVTHSVTVANQTSFSIYTVSDANNPLGCVLVCPQNIEVGNDVGQCGAVVNFSISSSVGCYQVSSVPSSGSFFPVGTTTVTYQAVDGNNNTSTCSFTVTVHDVTPPDISCPADISVNNDPSPAVLDQSNLSALYSTDGTDVWQSFTAGISGKLDSLYLGVQSPLIESPSPGIISIYSGQGTGGTLLATQNVTFQYGPFWFHQCFSFSSPAALTAGNVYSYRLIVPSINVTWIDMGMGNPYASGRSNYDPDWDFVFKTYIQPELGLCSAVVSYTTPVGSDNCSNPITVQTGGLPSGSVFPVGATTNTFRVTDASNNTSTCSFKVTVTDNSPPLITCPGTVNVNADQGKCYATVNDIGAPQTADNCGVQGTTNDKPGNDQYLVGNTSVVWTVTDIHGNTATCSQTVAVTDNQPPTITCPAHIYSCADLGKGYATILDLGTSQTGDNCGVQGTTNDKPADNRYLAGNTTVVWTVTDVNGNTATCSQTVTVYPDFVVGSISENQSICYNTAPAQLSSVAPTGGNTPYTYQWQSSTDNNSFFDILDATNPAYQPGALTQTTYRSQEHRVGSQLFSRLNISQSVHLL